MITLTSSKIDTLAEDDTIIDSVTQSGSAAITTGSNAIGQRKKIFARFTVETADDADFQIAIAGGSLYISLGAYLPHGIASILDKKAPDAGFSYSVPIDIVGSETPTAIPMSFYCNGNPYPESVRNLKAYFYYYASDDFAVEIEYYNCFDENGYLNSTSKGTEYRFISEQWNESNTKIIESSAYSLAKDLRILTYIENPLVEGFESHYSEIQEHVLVTQQLSKHDSVVQLMDSLGEAVTLLNVVSEQELTARFYSANTDLTDFYIKLIRIREDPAYSFFDNYDIIENKIESYNSTENVFKGPFSVDYNSYEGYYDLIFTIDPTYLEEGQKYRMVVSGYYNSGSVENSQGISEQLSASSVVPYCFTDCLSTEEFPTELVFTGSIIDIHDEYLGNSLTAAIEERLRTQLIVDFSNDRWKNNIDCRRYNSVGGDTATSNDIRKYFTGARVEIFESYVDSVLGGTVTNTFVQEIMYKSGQNSYTSQNINFAFDMTTEKLTMYYDFRNRNDAFAPCLYSSLNGNPYLPVIGNQYWGGKQLTIRWYLNFNYYDFPTPFIDTLYYSQTLNVRDYSDDVTIENWDRNVFCDADDFCLQASIVFANPENYKLVSTRQQISGVITENEGFGPDNLGQEIDTAISSSDNDYTGTNAKFCINGPQLLTGNTYKFSAMAKKWL